MEQIEVLKANKEHKEFIIHANNIINNLSKLNIIIEMKVRYKSYKQKTKQKNPLNFVDEQ